VEVTARLLYTGGKEAFIRRTGKKKELISPEEEDGTSGIEPLRY